MITTDNVNNHLNWVNVTEATDADKQKLMNEYKLTQEMLYYATDINERARIEINENPHSILVIYNSLTVDSSNNYKTEPVAFIISENNLITFTGHKDSRYVKDTLVKHITQDNSTDTKTILLKILYDLTILFLDKINELNTQREELQNLTQHNINQTSIKKLSKLETSIIYFLTSANSNHNLLTTMSHIKNLNLSDDQHELLEDIIIESQQAQEMIKILSNIIERLSASYSNVIDNNLNKNMKFLTIFSIVLAVPNIIFGFFGQNLALPLTHSGGSWIFTIILSIFLILVIYLVTNWNDFFKK